MDESSSETVFHNKRMQRAVAAVWKLTVRERKLRVLFLYLVFVFLFTFVSVKRTGDNSTQHLLETGVRRAILEDLTPKI